MFLYEKNKKICFSFGKNAPVTNPGVVIGKTDGRPTVSIGDYVINAEPSIVQYQVRCSEIENVSIILYANGAVIPSGTMVDDGTVVTLTVAPNSGYVYKDGIAPIIEASISGVSQTLDITSSGDTYTTSVTVTGYTAFRITAEVEIPVTQYTVSASVEDSHTTAELSAGGVIIASGASIDENTEVTVTVTPMDGYVFTDVPVITVSSGPALTPTASGASYVASTTITENTVIAVSATTEESA